MDLVIREAPSWDAEELVAYLRHLIDEPGLDAALTPGQCDLMAEQEKDTLAR